MSARKRKYPGGSPPPPPPSPPPPPNLPVTVEKRKELLELWDENRTQFKHAVCDLLLLESNAKYLAMALPWLNSRKLKDIKHSFDDTFFGDITKLIANIDTGNSNWPDSVIPDIKNREAEAAAATLVFHGQRQLKSLKYFLVAQKIQMPSLSRSERLKSYDESKSVHCCAVCHKVQLDDDSDEGSDRDDSGDAEVDDWCTCTICGCWAHQRCLQGKEKENAALVSISPTDGKPTDPIHCVNCTQAMKSDPLGQDVTNYDTCFDQMERCQTSLFLLQNDGVELVSNGKEGLKENLVSSGILSVIQAGHSDVTQPLYSLCSTLSTVESHSSPCIPFIGPSRSGKSLIIDFVFGRAPGDPPAYEQSPAISPESHAFIEGELCRRRRKTSNAMDKAIEFPSADTIQELFDERGYLQHKEIKESTDDVTVGTLLNFIDEKTPRSAKKPRGAYLVVDAHQGLRTSYTSSVPVSLQRGSFNQGVVLTMDEDTICSALKSIKNDMKNDIAELEGYWWCRAIFKEDPKNSEAALLPLDDDDNPTPTKVWDCLKDDIKQFFGGNKKRLGLPVKLMNPVKVPEQDRLFLAAFGSCMLGIHPFRDSVKQREGNPWDGMLRERQPWMYLAKEVILWIYSPLLPPRTIVQDLPGWDDLEPLNEWFRTENLRRAPAVVVVSDNGTLAKSALDYLKEKEIIKRMVEDSLPLHVMTNDKSNNLFLQSPEEEWNQMKISLDGYATTIKASIAGYVKEEILPPSVEGSQVAYSRETNAKAKAKARALVESLVTCGHVKPYLYVSTFMGIRTDKLKRTDGKVMSALERCGDVVKPVYQLLRWPNRRALESMKGTLLEAMDALKPLEPLLAAAQATGQDPLTSSLEEGGALDDLCSKLAMRFSKIVSHRANGTPGKASTSLEDDVIKCFKEELDSDLKKLEEDLRAHKSKVSDVLKENMEEIKRQLNRISAPEHLKGPDYSDLRNTLGPYLIAPTSICTIFDRCVKKIANKFGDALQQAFKSVCTSSTEDAQHSTAAQQFGTQHSLVERIIDLWSSSILPSAYQRHHYMTTNKLSVDIQHAFFRSMKQNLLNILKDLKEGQSPTALDNVSVASTSSGVSKSIAIPFMKRHYKIISTVQAKLCFRLVKSTRTSDKITTRNKTKNLGNAIRADIILAGPVRATDDKTYLQRIHETLDELIKGLDENIKGMSLMADRSSLRLQEYILALQRREQLRLRCSGTQLMHTRFFLMPKEDVKCPEPMSLDEMIREFHLLLPRPDAEQHTWRACNEGMCASLMVGGVQVVQTTTAPMELVPKDKAVAALADHIELHLMQMTLKETGPFKSEILKEMSGKTALEMVSAGVDPMELHPFVFLVLISDALRTRFEVQCNLPGGETRHLRIEGTGKPCNEVLLHIDTHRGDGDLKDMEVKVASAVPTDTDGDALQRENRINQDPNYLKSCYKCMNVGECNLCDSPGCCLVCHHVCDEVYDPVRDKDRLWHCHICRAIKRHDGSVVKEEEQP